jgi:hypothetical protein
VLRTPGEPDAERSGNDWWFWADTPIDFNQGTGTFTVPGTSGTIIDGAGYRNTTAKRLEVSGMSEDLDGQIYPSTHTWEADFTQMTVG